jgi:hypothetical protein
MQFPHQFEKEFLAMQIKSVQTSLALAQHEIGHALDQIESSRIDASLKRRVREMVSGIVALQLFLSEEISEAAQ